jgi:hypothetical protein
VRVNPGRAGRSSRRSWNGWSRYEREYDSDMTPDTARND